MADLRILILSNWISIFCMRYQLQPSPYPIKYLCLHLRLERAACDPAHNAVWTVTQLHLSRFPLAHTTAVGQYLDRQSAAGIK